MKHLTLAIKTLEKKSDGGTIVISTPSVDRMSDRVIPTGARIENYLRNPVVQWGHNYDVPWATIGRTHSLSVSPEGLQAQFELRPAANDQDPMNVVRLLWEGDWVRTASIGFKPLNYVGNDVGGYDFTEWELLEWSLVPIPANQDALRLAVRGLEAHPNLWQGWDADDVDEHGDMPLLPVRAEPMRAVRGLLTLDDLRDALDGYAVVSKKGRVLSAKNEQSLREAYERIGGVLSQLDAQDTEEGKRVDAPLALPVAAVETDHSDEPVSDADVLALFMGVRQFTEDVKEALK